MKIWDLIIGILTFLSLMLAFISEEYRIIAIIFAFVLSIILIVSLQSLEISNLKLEQRKLSEKLKIYKRLAKIEERLKI